MKNKKRADRTSALSVSIKNIGHITRAKAQNDVSNFL